MKKFLIKSAIFIVILFAIDRIGNLGLQFVRPVDYKLFVDAKREFFRSDTPYDMLIVGDSHIADALDPRAIYAGSGYRSFNLGIYASTPFENYFTFRAALKTSRPRPSFLVIGTNPGMFMGPPRIGRYTPVIVDNVFEKWYMSIKSDRPLNTAHWFRLLQEQYLFQSLKRMVLGIPYVPTRDIHAIADGYLEARNKIEGTRWDVDNEYEGARVEEQVEYLRQTIQLARSVGIQPIIVHPPLLPSRLEREKDQPGFKGFLKEIDTIAGEFDVPVFNQRMDTLNTEFVQGDFLTADHLNFYGASKFTRAFAGWMAERTKQDTTEQRSR
jgi:hypothetical protein